ncbi:MAG: hypothetical protein AB8B96_09520 [Lysobacterales bacterium]
MSHEEPPNPPPAEDAQGPSKSIRQRAQHELTRPGGIGDNTHGLIRRWCRKIWKNRGGGLYAVGFAVTFVYLELVELITDDIPKFFSINLLSSDLVKFVVQFIVDTLWNTLLAFMWPATLIQWQWPIGIICLAAGFYLFPRVVQGPLERWMFDHKRPS